MTQSELSAQIYPSTADISADIWDAFSQNQPNANPFLSHAFFNALEVSNSATPQTGWHPQHILLSQGNTPVGLMPLFGKSHSQGEYVFDHPWAEALHRAGGNYYPKLQSSVPFTPVTTPKLLTNNNDLQLQTTLLHTAQELCQRMNASSVHATFLTKEEQQLATNLDWLPRHDIQFHWKNQSFTSFEDFLKTLASRKRKAILRERKKALSENITINWIEGKDITQTNWDSFFEFYHNTSARKWGRPYLTREFFSLISQTMPQNLLLMIAHRDGKPIAGTLNFKSQNTLFGRYWGCVEDVAFLHFELCYYQAIDYAITHGLDTVEAGAQGTHKLARGYQPITTRSIHFIANPGLREAVQNYLRHERNAVQQDQETLNQAAPFKNI